MGRLTKDQVLEHTYEFREQEVDLPELGGSVLIRQLSAAKQSRMLEGLIDFDTGGVTDLEEMQARQFAASCVDPGFTVEEARDLMKRWPAEEWRRVTDAIQALSPAPQEVKRAAAVDFRDGQD